MVSSMFSVVHAGMNWHEHPQGEIHISKKPYFYPFRARTISLKDLPQQKKQKKVEEREGQAKWRNHN